MRVVYVTRGFTDYTTELVNAMASVVEPHLVLVSRDEFVAREVKPSVRVFKSRAPRVSSLGNLSALFRLVRHIRDIKPDLLHIQSGVVWELALQKFFPALPMVLTCHDITTHPTYSRMLLTPQFFITRAAMQADALIVHSPRLVEHARRRFGERIQGKPVFSVPIGLHTRFGTGTAPAEAPSQHVLLFGSIDRYKGVEYLLAAEPLIRKELPGVRFKMAGRCMHRAHYERLVAGKDAVECRFGEQTDAQVTELFRWADVLVLPYIEASQSAVIQVGLAFGLPMVVTNVGGLPDVIQDEVNGLVVPPRDVPAFARAVVRLLTDVELRRKVVSNVVACRETQYAWGEIAKQYADIYRQVIALKSGKKICVPGKGA